jgi:bifunctional enzyme CysN/CysC
MEQPSTVIAPEIEACESRQPGLLRFITCGSVDDGKSTLIGRLLYESKTLSEDQLADLESDSRSVGTRRGELDFALLVDGLAAEREQGITIDVAYRFFSTERRTFIIADTPGHEQYTRNMITGASTAGLAVILIDARKGLLTQTRRHSYLVSLIGIRHIVIAINKMDLVDYSASAFRVIEQAYRVFAAQIGLGDITVIPVSAVHGDNVVASSANMPWYSGPSLLTLLETVDIDPDTGSFPFRLPVQWVNRPNADFRGFAGTIASGVIRRGDRVRVAPSGRDSAVARIVTADGDLPEAMSGEAVTLTLTTDIDVSRGDVITSYDDPIEVADQFEATVVWMHDEPMLQGRQYRLQLGTQTALATVMPLKYTVNVNSLDRVPAERLELNDVGVCELELDRAVAFEPYGRSRTLGGFLLIDRLTNDTIGAGLLHFALRRSQNIHWQALDVDRHARAMQKGQRGCVLWLTGLSGAGKSAIANRIDQQLVTMGHHTAVLDGDNIRHGLSKDLGFTSQDRVENIRRVAEVSKLMADAGLITLVSFISPFRSERRMARELMGPEEFIEVFVDTPLDVAESRDTKGLYTKARQGLLRNFTGIDSPYEVPDNPEIRIDTVARSVTQAAEEIVEYLAKTGVLSPRARAARPRA